MRRRKALKRMLYFAASVVILFASWNLWQERTSSEKAESLYDTLALQAAENSRNEQAFPDGAAGLYGGSARQAADEADGAAGDNAAANGKTNGKTNVAAPSGSKGDGAALNGSRDDNAAPSGAADEGSALKASAGELPEEALAPENEWLLGLREKNDDLAAWIRIPNTNIDYPVMQSKTDADYYLHRNFDKAEEFHGTPYLDINCDLRESENLIIYGHNMKDGSMFQNLMRYKDADFCKDNGLILFSTPEKTYEYQVFLVMLISAEEAEAFPFYRYIELPDDDSYQTYLEKCKSYAIFSSGESIESGTRLLTLSTCEYSKEDGRLVVIARR